MEGGRSHFTNDYTSPGNDTHSRPVQATRIFQDWISNFVVCTHVGYKGFRIGEDSGSSKRQQQIIVCTREFEQSFALAINIYQKLSRLERLGSALSSTWEHDLKAPEMCTLSKYHQFSWAVGI